MITVAGTLVADVLVRPIRNWAGKGHNTNVDEIDLLPGGTVANTGLALARLGIPVSAWGAVGDDPFGAVVNDSIGRWAARNRVQAKSGARTTTSIVAVFEDGDRCFLSTAGACDLFEMKAADIESEIAAGSKALHIGYAGRLPKLDGEPLIQFMRYARERDLLTSLDVTYFPDPGWPRMRRILPEIDVFCPSLIEAKAITGEKEAEKAAIALVNAGVRKFVAITDGSKGAFVQVVGEKIEFIPAREVNVVDTTGAGDSFIAGVLATWYCGHSWKLAGRMGAYVASVAITNSNRYGNLRNFRQMLSDFLGSEVGRSSR